MGRLLTSLVRTLLTRSHAPFRFTSDNDEQLDYSRLGGLGLYVHIPFCRTLCNFCPYCKQRYDTGSATAYTEALLQEIHRVGAMAESHPTPCTSLYFGGGTPALLAKDTGRIIAALRQHYQWEDGTGTELHPADVNERTLSTLREAGVTRISIGIQSFQPQFSQLLGRPAPDAKAIARALDAVPFPTVSMDFIFALPGQSAEDVGRDIELAFAHGANHVATYPFIDFSFTPSRLTAMQKEMKRRMLLEITDYCAQRGLVRDSIWTFAKPGGHRYSSMTRDCFLGFGCSATTLLRDSFKVNTFSVPAYIERVRAGMLPTSLTTRFTRRQRMLYWLFWRAYSTYVDRADFRAFFGTELEDEFGLIFALACRAGWLRREAGGYQLTPEGAFRFHHYENDYTLAYIDKMWGVLRQQDFPEGIVL